MSEQTRESVNRGRAFARRHRIFTAQEMCDAIGCEWERMEIVINVLLDVNDITPIDGGYRSEIYEP